MQRKHEAMGKVNKIEKIMDADGTDTKTFFKIIKAQRTTKDNLTPYIIVNENKYEEENILSGWADYFEDLAAPKQNTSYDAAYEKRTNLNVELLSQVHSLSPNHAPAVQEGAVLKAICTMKNNKAADMQGISAEHLKHAKDQIVPLLTNIVNDIQVNRTVPSTFKMGVVTPILKKGKLMHLPDSYRRITVTSIPNKVLEKIVLPSIDIPMATKQSRMQRGFTNGSSSSNTALLYTEILAEASDMNKPLYTAMLDASKAFDVVVHNNLLMALHKHDLNGTHWLLTKDWYTEMSSQIKWKGELSRVIAEKIGLRQGGGLSAGQYKTYTNRHLIAQEDASLGTFIGTTYVGCPTCADDTALVHHNAVDLQVALNLSSQFANQERFQFSSTKTKILIHGNSSYQQQTPIWTLNGKDIQIVDSQEHLGIKRDSNKHELGTKTSDSRIQSGRRTVYSMFGTGLHGLNGLNPKTSIRIWKIYVVPRLIHNLDVTKNSKTMIQKIEDYQRQSLKQIQNLPPNTSNAATYLLCGVLPIEAEVDKRTLSTFGRIIRDPTTAEYDIVRRQIAVKGLSSNSWTSKVKKLTHKYDLPSVYELLEFPPSKEEWKLMIKKAIHRVHMESLKDETVSQTTVRYLNTSLCSLTHPHTVWQTVQSSVRDVTRAMVKAKLLTGTYSLESKKIKYGKADTGICPLCHEEVESREHFVVLCPSLQDIRTPYVTQFRDLIKTHLGTIESINSTSPSVILRNILDPSHVSRNPAFIREAERITRCLCYALHHTRTALLRADDNQDQPLTSQPNIQRETGVLLIQEGSKKKRKR